MCTEVYSIDEEPHLVDDLGLLDMRILQNIYDSVRRDEKLIPTLWEKLRYRRVHRRWDVQPPPGFRDPQCVKVCGSKYPKVLSASSEGKRIWKGVQLLERNRRLSQAAKEANRECNDGLITCEACALSDKDSSLLDAHHHAPLMAGCRESRVNDFIVLCPTCRRWAHRKAPDKLSPLSILELRKLRFATF